MPLRNLDGNNPRSVGMLFGMEFFRDGSSEGGQTSSHTEDVGLSTTKRGIYISWIPKWKGQIAVLMWRPNGSTLNSRMLTVEPQI